MQAYIALLDLRLLFSFEGAVCGGRCSPFRAQDYAPLAQLVEHLTLNQGVQGSSP
jgi:hypothetical protein